MLFPLRIRLTYMPVWVVTFTVNELSSFRCGFLTFQVFNDKFKIVFSICATINVEEFHFSYLFSCADLTKRYFQATVVKCRS